MRPRDPRQVSSGQPSLTVYHHRQKSRLGRSKKACSSLIALLSTPTFLQWVVILATRHLLNGSWAQPKEVRDLLLYQAVRVLLQSPEPLSHPTPTPTAPRAWSNLGGSEGRGHCPPLGDLGDVAAHI